MCCSFGTRSQLKSGYVREIEQSMSSHDHVLKVPSYVIYNKQISTEFRKSDVFVGPLKVVKKKLTSYHKSETFTILLESKMSFLIVLKYIYSS